MSLLKPIIITLLLLFISGPLLSQDTSILFQEGFESGDFSNWNEQGLALIYETDCHSGNYCAEYDFNRTYGIQYVTFDETFEKAYLSFWIKFDDDFMFGLEAPGGKHLVRFYDLSGASPVPQMDTGWGPTSQYSFMFFTRDGDSSFTYRIPNPFTPGIWQYYELYFEFNDPGLSNGNLEFFVDGVSVLKEENIVLRDGVNSSVEFDTLAFTNYDNGYHPDEYPRYWIDDILLMKTIPDEKPLDDTGTSDGAEASDGNPEPDLIQSRNDPVTGGCGLSDIRNKATFNYSLVLLILLLSLSLITFKNRGKI